MKHSHQVVLLFILAVFATFQDVQGMVLTTSPGNFTSPNYPEKYPSDVSVYWYIVAPRGQYIELTFTSFELEGSRGCRYDFVTIKEVTDTDEIILDKICGRNSRERTYRTSGNYMVVSFESDSDKEEDGFAATYVFIPAETTTSKTTSTRAVTTEGATLKTTEVIRSTASTTRTTTGQSRNTRDPREITTQNPVPANITDVAIFPGSSESLSAVNLQIVVPLVILLVIFMVAFILLTIFTCLQRKNVSSRDPRYLMNPNYDEHNVNMGFTAATQDEELILQPSIPSSNFPSGYSFVRKDRGRQNLTARSTTNTDMMYSVIEDIVPRENIGHLNRNLQRKPSVHTAGNPSSRVNTDIDPVSGNPESQDVYNCLREKRVNNSDRERYSQLTLDESFYDHTDTSSRITVNLYAKVDHNRHTCTCNSACACHSKNNGESNYYSENNCIITKL